MHPLRPLPALLVAAAMSAAAGAHAGTHGPVPSPVCSVLGGHPCHPSFCSVFHRGPCFPYFWPPIGEDLRLTIVSTDDGVAGASTEPPPQKTGAITEAPALDSIGDLYAALRACWVPPPHAVARHGMQYTVRFAFRRDGAMIAPPRTTYASHDAPAAVRDAYRDAVDAALTRCTPVHFSRGMGGAVAGRPIAIRFVDDRTLDRSVQ